MRFHENFSARRERNDTVQSAVIFTATCYKCDGTDTFRNSKGSILPPEFVGRKFKQKGWEIGQTRRADVCPKCAGNDKIERLAEKFPVTKDGKRILPVQHEDAIEKTKLALNNLFAKPKQLPMIRPEPEPEPIKSIPGFDLSSLVQAIEKLTEEVAGIRSVLEMRTEPLKAQAVLTLPGPSPRVIQRKKTDPYRSTVSVSCYDNQIAMMRITNDVIKKLKWNVKGKFGIIVETNEILIFPDKNGRKIKTTNGVSTSFQKFAGSKLKPFSSRPCEFLIEGNNLTIKI